MAHFTPKPCKKITGSYLLQIPPLEKGVQKFQGECVQKLACLRERSDRVCQFLARIAGILALFQQR